MSSFSLTAAQRSLLERAQDRGKALSRVAAGGRTGRVNRALVAELGKAGLLAELFPAALGGARTGTTSALDVCLLREGLARSCTEAETALALQGLGGYPIILAGNDAQARRWVPPVARGEAVAAFALSEPGAGSDAAALALRAERHGAQWRLTGEKAWISNAPEADIYAVFARTSDDGARGVTAFVVEGDAPGLSGEPVELLAPHAIGRLHFDGVTLPDTSRLGDAGAGFRVAMATLDLFRPSVGAFAVGMAQSALDIAIAHAGRRESFGKPLREFQAVSHRLADAATGIEAARLLVYAAAAAYDAGATVTKQAAMAKLFATEHAQRVVDDAVQILGAKALEAGHPLESLYRDVRATRIYEGTSEIQREIIARALYR